MPRQSAPVSPPPMITTCLPVGADLVLHLPAQGHPVRLGQELHRLVDAVQLPPGHRQIAADGRPDGQHDRVVALLQLPAGDLDPDLDAAPEVGALVLHLPDPAVQHRLLHLELGNAVAHQPARLVGAFEHRHGVTRAGELLGHGQPGRAGSDHGHRLAGVPLRRLRLDPALVPRLVDDGDLDVLDGHRVAVDADHAGGLARRRTEPSGELREVVGRVQPLQRLVPVPAPDQVVPLRDQVAQRASGVTERDAAVHAPPGLVGDDRQQGPPRRTRIDLPPVVDPLRHRPPLRHLPWRRHEPPGISHGRRPSFRAGSGSLHVYIGCSHSAQVATCVDRQQPVYT